MPGLRRAAGRPTGSTRSTTRSATQLGHGHEACPGAGQAGAGDAAADVRPAGLRRQRLAVPRRQAVRRRPTPVATDVIPASRMSGRCPTSWPTSASREQQWAAHRTADPGESTVSLPPLVEPAAELTVDEVRRYSRHLIIPDVGMDRAEAAEERQGARASAPAASARRR